MINYQKILQLLNILAFVAMITVNALANILPIAGKQTGELSAQYPNLFVPAGFTFSIWGLIYFLLLCFTLYQARGLFCSDADSSRIPDKIRELFFITCILNISWILAWHYELVLISVIIMLCLLSCLIIIYLRLKIGIEKPLKTEKIMMHIPFSVYLAWITVASIANITAFLVYIEWNRFGMSELFWFITMISICTIIGLITLYRRRDIFFCLVIIWSFVGILLRS